MVSTESIGNFFQSLKLALKAASIYQNDHPALINTVENLQRALDKSIAGNPFLKIGFTTQSITLGDSFLETEKVHTDVAEFFHVRKIKSIIFRKGVTASELQNLITSLNLPRHEIIRRGGITTHLNPDTTPHITVEELDYSHLLKGDGEVVKDVWSLLLQEAVTGQDENKLEDVVESFDRAIEKFSPKEVSEDINLQGNFSKFFDYLKDEKTDDFRSCAKKLIKTLVNNSDLSSEDKIENLATLVSDLSEEDLASTLWEEIISNENFNSLSFSIFSRLIQKEKHSNIANSLSDIFKANEAESSRPENREKLKELLAGTSTPTISAIYAQTLSAFMQDIDYDEKLIIEHGSLLKNYRFLLLNLLAIEDNQDNLAFILGKIDDEWGNISNEKDYEYLKLLYDILQDKISRHPSDARLGKTAARLVQTIENSILKGEVSLYFEHFLQLFEESTLDVNSYLDRIFHDGKITPYILKAFFTFFTEYLFYFDLNLDQKSGDSKFLEKLISSLELIDSPISIVTLKSVYNLGQTTVKLKVLKAMQKLVENDPSFLFSVLKGKSPALKGEALVILIREDRLKSKALELLFKFESPFGVRNRKLLEHIKILEDKDLRAAETALAPLRMRKGFWNRKIRSQANRILEHWHAEED